MAAFLIACGGGGGNPGTSTGGSGGTGTGTGVLNALDTLLSVQLTDASGAPSQSVAASGGSEFVATLTTKTGNAVPNQVVKFSTSVVFSDLIFFPNGSSATTDKNGIAKVKVNRSSLTKFGSGLLSASFSGTACDPCTANFQQYNSSSSNSLDFRTDPPFLKLELRDSANQVTTAIGATGFTTVQATLKFDDGTPVVQKRIDISGDPVKVAFPEGSSQLTNTAGLAIIKVTRASLDAKGAGTLNGATTISGVEASGAVDNTVVTGFIDYQVGGANIALGTLNLGSGSLAAFGNRPISVMASVNGIPASTTPVQVTFNASCGVVTPATVSTDASGAANSTYSANLATCAGTNVTISAAAVGATSLSGTIPVAPSIATNVQFISTTPQLIYLKESVGTTQAQVVFKVVDSSGNPLQNKKLRLALSNTATGVTLNTMGNVAPVDLTTNNLGLVSAAVFSGTVPTSLNVKATLLDANNAPTNIFSNSNLLTVASGRPVQRSLSLAFSALSIEGLNLDGASTVVTLSMADRQGNPVPPGTQVNFVSESGVLLPAVCFVPPVTPETASSPAMPTSSCSVVFKSQGTRTANGRVSVFAYVEGEENFVDVNGNNVYDSGEPFTDLGRAFRDDNGQAPGGANGIYDTGEFQVPRVATAACVAGVGCPGDGVWGGADVRKQGTLVLASSAAVITGAFQAAIGGVRNALDFVIADINGNSFATGSAVVVSPQDRTSSNGVACALAGSGSFVIGNSLAPSAFTTGFTDCKTGDAINVEVTSPSGLVTSWNFPIPVDGLATTAGTATSVGVSQTPLFEVVGGVAPFRFTSSDPLIATANSGLGETGNRPYFYIYGHAVGTAVITVTDSMGSSSAITVTVY